MPSRLSKLLQGTAVASLTTVGAFFVWTKHCKFEELDPATDPTFQTTFYKKFNLPAVVTYVLVPPLLPYSTILDLTNPSATPNPTTHDLCVRRIPVFKLRPDLTEDAAKGGSKLLESFCAGVWGGFGYTIQREYLRAKYKDPTRTGHQLWSKKELLSSSYNTGTEITDHFVVLDKTPTTILIRCGDSPLNAPNGPRPSDGLFEITADLHADEGFCEFRLKSLFYQGLGKSATGEPPMHGFMLWAHYQYTKLWMESAVRNVMR